jgi:hypothetical protein
MNIKQRQQCDGLDDASIMETMAWLKEQCTLLHFELQSASDILTDKRERAEMPSPMSGGSEG